MGIEVVVIAVYVHIFALWVRSITAASQYLMQVTFCGHHLLFVGSWHREIARGTNGS